MDKTLVIIPAYNEELNIPNVVSGIKKYAGGIDILTVNDGSGDSTSAVAAACGSMVVDLPFNAGYGTALQTGYKFALNNGYDYVVQMDADGQHDPKYIPDLLGEIRKNEADVIIGSRFLSKDCYKIPFLRSAGMTVFNKLSSYILKQKITDSTSGYQALNRDVLKFYAHDIYPCDYPDADVLIMLRFSGFRIKEIPVVMLESKSGKSMHAGFKAFYYVFKMFLSILVTLLRGKPISGRANRCS